MRTIIIVLLVLAAFGAAGSELVLAASAVETECTLHVGYNLNTDLPGFSCDDPSGSVCVPFTPTIQLPPANVQGDFYVDEFTDAKLKAKWLDCEQHAECVTQVQGVINYGIGGVPHEFRNTGTVSDFGKIDPHVDWVNLVEIRRPAFFGEPPYNEDIAKVDNNTSIVEFTVPRDAYERLHLQKQDSIKLRGWFIEGAGLEDPTGKRIHAVAIMIGGRSIETTAIHHPEDPLYAIDETSGQYKNIPYPSPQGRTEKWGLRQWRQYLYALNQVGFDVLTVDKRGHGISGGLNDMDTAEQAEDIFRMLDQLETGNGLCILTQTGEILKEEQAAGRLLRGQKAKEVPVILGGPSQGSMVTIWAMQKNFAEFCAYQLPTVECTSPAQYGYNIRGALLLADFAAGVGYTAPIFGLVEGYLRSVENIMLFPSSEVLATIDAWPAVFFGKGLWDSYESIEGSFDAYQRVTGLKEIVVVRGPHSENEFGTENVAYMIERMINFARHTILTPDAPIAGPATLKDLVCSSPPSWEPSTKPSHE
ncbi:hypothetical protein U27_05346 [Candidatus Vecturithrix granuli]|uniref:Serine aminopeptidase S33 domain-containing protein n=1 Tax=Vecturithrix granuli TaxID=1499967 RepID=A0A081C1B7_VECG1|nr:hypothetical protein U27_05346 [Candidatus Vecturithrix granuli]